MGKTCHVFYLLLWSFHIHFRKEIKLMHIFKLLSLVTFVGMALNGCTGADISHNFGNVKDSLFSVGSIFTPAQSQDAKVQKKNKQQKDIDSSKDNENALLECPRIEYIEELSIVDKYKDNTQPHPDGLEYSANIAHFESSCRILPDKQQADIEIYIRFYAELGDAGRLKPENKVTVSHPYFIATLDKNNDIVNKQVETLTMEYGAGENEITKLEKISYVMPFDSSYDAKDYRVVMGFILTKTQIENNRRDYQF
jgi:hypothetical protein